MGKKFIPQKAVAYIQGGPLAPEIRGKVTFTAVTGGTNVTAIIKGLPDYRPPVDDRQQIGPHGFHIHERGICKVGKPENPFQAAGGHWAPDDQPHGNHAGDFPVLFSNKGRAKMKFFTNRFNPEEIINLSVIIHEGPDDYQTQPDGAAGKRLACGIIK